MELLPVSFLAGILTVLAPCVFTLLPVVLGGTLTGDKSIRKPLTIIISLGISIFVFTLILKASTLLILVHPNFWKVLSGGIIFVFGIVTLFPQLWDQLSVKLGLSNKSNKVMFAGSKRGDMIGDILIGAALGPVFSACSPTYVLIFATILPQDFITGIVNLIVYILGLSLILLLIAVFGQKVTKNLKWASNPHGLFKKVLGILFIVVGLAVMTGFDKSFETFLLNNGILDVTKIEFSLLENMQ